MREPIRDVNCPRSLASTNIEYILGAFRDGSTKKWVLLHRLYDGMSSMASLHRFELLVVGWEGNILITGRLVSPSMFPHAAVDLRIHGGCLPICLSVADLN